jgi:hypothetical protein
MKKTVIHLSFTYSHESPSCPFFETGVPDLGLSNLKRKITEELFKAGLAGNAVTFKELTLDLLVESPGEPRPELSEEQLRAVDALTSDDRKQGLTVTKFTVKSLGISTL